MTPETYAGPFALFLACAASGLVMPVPEDVAILVAGWQVEQGTLAPLPAFAAALTGTLTRDTLAFLVGRVVADRLAESRFARRFGLGRVLRLRERMAERAARAVFWARFAIGVRSILYFVGGTLDISFRRFLVLDLLGLLITTPLLLGLGGRYGTAATAWLTGALVHQQALLGTLTFLGVAAWLLSRYRRSTSTGAPPEGGNRA